MVTAERFWKMFAKIVWDIQFEQTSIIDNRGTLGWIQTQDTITGCYIICQSSVIPAIISGLGVQAM